MENQDQNHDDFFEQGHPSSLPPTEEGPGLGDRFADLLGKAAGALSWLPDFFSRIIGRFRARRVFVYALLITIVVILPLHYLLKAFFQNYFEGFYGQQAILANTELKEGDVIIDGPPTVISRTEDSGIGVIHLRNKHRGVGGDSIEYSWSAYDKNGILLAGGSGFTYILPEQDKFIVIPLSGETERLEAEVRPEFVQSARPVFSRTLELKVLNTQYANSENGFSVDGQVSNESLFDLEMVEVVTIMRSPGGEIRAAVSTLVGSIKAGLEQPFHVTWPRSLPDDTVVDVRLYTNIYSPLNISLPDNVTSSPNIR